VNHYDTFIVKWIVPTHRSPFQNPVKTAFFWSGNEGFANTRLAAESHGGLRFGFCEPDRTAGAGTIKQKSMF
jgi:hypothetical protein